MDTTKTELVQLTNTGDIIRPTRAKNHNKHKYNRDKDDNQPNGAFTLKFLLPPPHLLIRPFLFSKMVSLGK